MLEAQKQRDAVLQHVGQGNVGAAVILKGYRSLLGKCSSATGPMLEAEGQESPAIRSQG